LVQTSILPLTAQKLTSVISNITQVLGDTATGKSWCAKALHPSDGLVECKGIPDKSAIPSVMINYQSTARLSAPSEATDSWNFAATMLPHPVNFGFAVPIDNDGRTPIGSPVGFLNQQLAGTTHADKMGAFMGQVERWRLAYMGVSVHFDGPALANQGSVVVNQTAYAPRTFCVSGPAAPGAPTLTEVLRPVCFNDAYNPSTLYQGPDFPQYDKSASMPNSYTGQIKDGLYIPLKLTRTCQNWRSKSDLVYWSQTNNVAFDSSAILPAATSNLQFPHPGLQCLAMLNGSRTGGGETSSFLNDVVAHVCGRNISVNAGLVFTFRVGIEAQVEPGSVLSPYQQVSPMYDSAALKAYFQVARELKDAYPVEYNDKGILWNVITDAARTVSKLLGTSGALGMPYAGAISHLLDQGVGLAERVRSKYESGEQAPAATKQALQAQVIQQMAQAPSAKKKKRTRSKSAPARKQSLTFERGDKRRGRV